jgi:hypothetical protein
MKTIKKIMVCATVVTLSSCATEFKIVGDDVPQVVKTAFTAKYPDVTNPEWEVEKEEGRLIYEAEFKLGGKKKEAEFKPDGTFIKEE